MRCHQERKNITLSSVSYVGHYVQQVSWQLFDDVIIPEIKSESLFPLGAYLKIEVSLPRDRCLKIEVVS